MISYANQKLIYSASLILSKETKKTAQALAKVSHKSGDTLLRILDHYPVTFIDLINLSRTFFNTSKLFLIIDDSLLKKMHSKLIGGSSDNYDSSIKSTYRSICFVAAMLTDGHYALPIDHKIWIRESFTDSYRSKEQLAQELITAITSHYHDLTVLMDGLYATQIMIKWLNENNIRFEMRFHSNRVIDHNGKQSSIKECAELQLKNNWNKKTIKIYWKGIPLYISVIKRKHKRRGYVITYQASNYKSLAKTHMRIYGYRWNIEKFFRTGKQSLGLQHCQSRKQKLQENHIMNVFGAYAILEMERKKRGLKNPETALKKLKLKNYSFLIEYLSSADQIFGAIHA